jgi:TolB-like protein/Flp pilus assembly protein TadD
MASSPHRPVVAVLPFENLGGEEDAYFAAGITDEITSRLALIDGLGVISRTSARLYAGTRKSIREVGGELGSDFVLEGSIRWDKSREPGRVRISPRLIRVEDDTNVWLHNYEREVTEIFDVQATIASRIAEALDITLMAPAREALEDRPTENIDAYQAYLQGLKQLHAPGFSGESFALGVRMFERATGLDPGFALAHARLSSMHSRTYHYGFDRSSRRLELARAAADRALLLDDDLATAHIALAHYFYWGTREYDRATIALERAQALEPNNGEIGLTMAYVKRRQGKFEDAIELLERDRALSPRDPNVFIALGESHGVVRDFDAAESNFRHAISLAPDDPYPYTELALLLLRWRGDVEGAREALRSMPQVGNAESTRVRFLVELLDRQYDDALAVLDDAPADVIEAGAFFIPVDQYVAEAELLSGRDAEATAAFGRARELLAGRLAENEDDQRIHAALGVVYAGLGREQDARHHAMRAVELAPPESDALSAPIQVIQLARTLALLGDIDGALEQIDLVLTIPSSMSTAWLEADPRWDSLRQDPGYAELLTKHRNGDSH